MIEWFVAKYMPDLRRREPQNVGVILSVDGALSFRFRGEKSDGTIDGRRPRFASSVDNYRDWVHYWRSLRSADQLPLIRQATDNYYLERGGQQLVGTADSPSVVLEALFAQLVAPVESIDQAEREPDPVSMLVESIGESADFEIERDPIIDTEVASFPFDYGIHTGGVTLLLRKLMFNGSRRKTWDALLAATTAVLQVGALRPNEYSPYVIGFEREPGDDAEKQEQAAARLLQGRFHHSQGLEADKRWLSALRAHPGQLPS